MAAFSSNFRLLFACGLLALAAPTRVLSQEKSNAEYKRIERNVFKAQGILSGCRQEDKDDSRELLNHVSKSMIQSFAGAPSSQCQPQDSMNYLVQRLQNYHVMAFSVKQAEDDQYRAEFSRALRLKALKNALMTFLDAEARYNLQHPEPQAMYKVATAVKEVCKDSNGKETCDGVTKAELEKLTKEYRAAFAKTGQKPISLATAQEYVNGNLAFLNMLYEPVHQATENLRSATKPLDNPTSREIYEKQTAFAIKHQVLPKSKAYDQARLRYMEAIRQADGLLLYTKAVKNEVDKRTAGHYSVKNPEVIRAAIQEIKSEALKLAHDSNDQLAQIQGDDDARDAFKKMVRSNPIAAGQLLVENPEFAYEVCAVNQALQKEARTKKYTEKGLEVAMWGGVIVGGVLALTGVGTPAGAALMAGSAQGLTTVGTVALVNTAVTTVATVGSLSYVGVHYVDLKNEVAMNRNGLITGSGGDLQKMESAEAALAQIPKETMTMAAMIILPFGAGKIAKAALGTIAASGTGAAKILDDLYLAAKTNPRIAGGVKLLDVLCGIQGNLACQMLTSSFHSLPKTRQTELLTNPEKMRSWTQTEIIRQTDAKDFYPSKMTDFAGIYGKAGSANQELVDQVLKKLMKEERLDIPNAKRKVLEALSSCAM